MNTALRFGTVLGLALLARSSLGGNPPPTAAHDLLRHLQAETRNAIWIRAWEHEISYPFSLTPPADLKVVFVPGFGHRTLSGNGADLLGPRRALEAMGFRCELAPLRDTAAVEANAVVLADYLRRLPEPRIWLVSASTGGPTTAETLTQLTDDALVAPRLEVWVNIGGLLHGTALADDALAWPKRWLARAVFAACGWDFAAVRSLATETSRARAR